MMVEHNELLVYKVEADDKKVFASKNYEKHLCNIPNSHVTLFTSY